MRNLRQVCGQAAEREAFWMRPPVERLLGQAFQDDPRHRRFVIELRKDGFTYVHAGPIVLYDPPFLKSTFGAALVSAGASKYGYSLNPKMPAVMFEGNFRRVVLYS